MPRRRTIPRWNLFELENRLTPANTPPVLLGDLNTALQASSPLNFCEVNGTLFFTATNAATGIELYRSDGTSTGTALVKDIYAGTASSTPFNLCNVNGTLYFAATGVGTGTELWKSDGTDSGTVLVKDIVAGPGGSNPNNFIARGSRLVFVADNVTNGREPWSSNGTATGTTLIRDIWPGSGSSVSTNFTEVNGLIAFTANEPATGVELWQTDGVTATQQVDHQPGSNSSNISNLINVGGTLYFQGVRSSVSNVTLWKSALGQPEPAATQPVTTTAQAILFNTEMTNVNGTVYFKAYRADVGYELFKSDGTSSGTTLVKDIRPGNPNGDIAHLANVNGTLLFAANDGVSGIELWKTDGTSAGTTLVRDVFPGSTRGHFGTPLAIDGTYYFSGNEGTASGIELWKSDGTSSGTVLVKDIYPGVSSSGLRYLTNVNGTLLFRAADDVAGSQLWKSDGTGTGTAIVRTINMQTESSSPSKFIGFGNRVAFGANAASLGHELWNTDGTTAGTALVRDIAPGTSSGLTNATGNRYLETFQGMVYFGAYTTGSTTPQLWCSDGTSSGTRVVADLLANATSIGPALTQFTPVGNLLYFAAYSNNSYNLWRTDGTSAGTQKLIDFGLSPAFAYLTNCNGRLMFSNTDSNSGQELWTSDGTVAGTKLICDIAPGTLGSAPRFLTNVNGRLFFSAITPTPVGRELWTSDGTSAGTSLVRDIDPSTSIGGPFSSTPSNLTNSNGKLFFTASTSTSGQELWTSDGTSAGTVLVKDINPGSGSSFISGIVPTGNTLFFPATDGFGTALWASDGTSIGTRKVHNVVPYNDNFGFRDFSTNVGGFLYFAGTLNGQFRELWRSDGTSAGTTMIDIEAISASSPSFLTANGNRLFFNAFQLETNIEPYTLTEDNPLPSITALSATTANGVVTTGQTVTLQLTFSEPVTLAGGNLLIRLDTGGTAVVTPFSGTTATATYTVAAGETSPDLNALTASLTAGATLRDATNQDFIKALPEPNLAVLADIIVNPLAPTTVANVIVNLGAVQRSRVTTIQVNFSQIVNAAVLNAPGGIVLRRVSDGLTLRTGFDLPARIRLNATEGFVTSVTLTFFNVNGETFSPALEAGSLRDGRWRLSIPYFNYESADILRLFGDATGDGTIDGNDLNNFGNAFNTNDPAFDYDGNGTIDGSDLAQFGNRFGITI